MIDSASILHDLDLLDDWLAGKGYGEEAGLVLQAMTLINKLQDGVRSTIQERDVLSGENFDLRAENAKLRAATLEDAAMLVDRMKNEIANGQGEYSLACIQIARRIRAAAAALKETGDE